MSLKTFSLGGKAHLSAEFFWGKRRVLFSKIKETLWEDKTVLEKKLETKISESLLEQNKDEYI